ncbi:MAG: type II secretion system protein [Synergistetes bacterium]|nr:type II secretion system protein [Synergistota bacterium]MDK2871879.1 hypothetical protein [bacterium]
MRKSFSLLEVLITISILVVGVFALYSLFYTIEFSGEREKSRFVMLRLAEGKLEEMMYGITDDELPSSLPAEFVFDGLENNLAKLPSYYSNTIKEDNVYNGISYSCSVKFSTSSVSSSLIIRVKVWESERPSRFVEVVGARQR